MSELFLLPAYNSSISKLDVNPLPPPAGKELAISALGAVSNAAEEAIVPFLGQVMEHLKVYLTAPDTEDGIRLKTQAIDTLSVFARKIGLWPF